MTKNIHDAAFKKLMSDREFFIGFCEHYLPADLKQKIDFAKCELFKLNGETVHGSIERDTVHKAEISDIIYKVSLKETEQPGLILIHAEHFSKPKKNIILRCVNYALNALTEFNQLNPKLELPVLIPFIYYQGRPSPFPHSLNIYDLFGKQKNLAEKYLLNPLLIDLNQQSDEELAKHQPISAAELAMKYALSKKPLDRKKINLLIGQFSGLADQVRLTVLNYAVSNIDYNRDEFVQLYCKQLSDDEDNIMTIAEQWKQEGMQQGMQQGIAHEKLLIAKKLISEGTELAFIARITGISVRELNRLPLN